MISFDLPLPRLKNIDGYLDSFDDMDLAGDDLMQDDEWPDEWQDADMQDHTIDVGELIPKPPYAA